MVVTCWSAWYLGHYWLPQDVTGNYYGTIYSITNILETAMIDALVLGSAEALFILLRMSLE